MSWAPLTPDGADPVPGDPNEVRALQAWFQQMADDVHQAAGDLRNAQGSLDWRSPAAKEFQGHLGNLESDFGKLSSSFGRAATGLSSYATALANAQWGAQGLLAQAQQNPQDQALLQQLRNQLTGYEGDRDRAAQTCVNVLDQAENLGMRNSFASWFGRHVVPAVTGVVHWVDDHLQDISDWCTRIGIVLAVIGLLVPGLQWLEIVSWAIMGIGMLADLGLTLEGKMDWKMFVPEVALTVGTLGLGVVAGRMGKAAVDAVEEAKAPLEDAVKDAAGLLAKRQQALADALSSGKTGRTLGAFKGWVTRADSALQSATRTLSPSQRLFDAFSHFLGEGSNPDRKSVV